MTYICNIKMMNILLYNTVQKTREKQQKKLVKDTHIHTTEAIWVELFFSCGLWSLTSPFIMLLT